MRIIRGIFARLGYVPRGEFDARSEELRREIARLRRAIRPAHVVPVDATDPAPTDPKARAAYVADVTTLFDRVMRPKLIAMIADGRDQLETIERETYGYTQAEFDLYLRGTLNGLWLIHEWGQEMRNELAANMRGEGAEDQAEADIQTARAALIK